MVWCIHNLHAPAVEIDAAGSYSHDSTHRIAAPLPLHTAETREDAEAWRAERLSDLKKEDRA